MNDLRFALRQLLKSPGFATVAIVTLALGIGANTAIFSLVNGVLLRPLPFPESQRIVAFEGVNAAQGIAGSDISLPDFVEWSKQANLFAASAAFYTGNANLAADGTEPERVPRAGVTAEFFNVLGVQPARGRGFRPEDDQPDNLTVALISDGLWKRRFGSDPAIIGRKISVSARSVTVIGVMGPRFDFPSETQIWTTSAVNPEKEPRDNRSYSAIARLQPGVEVAGAQAQLSALNARLASAFTETNHGWDTRVSHLQDRMVREVRPSLLALFGAVGFVLLIACANVANLLLARAAGRRKEIAIRAAIGASRLRVIRQMLTESLLLSAIGGVLGLLLSVWLTDVLFSLLPEDGPRFAPITVDYRVLLFVSAISLLTGIIFGLLPALSASRLDLIGSLKEGGRAEEGNRRTPARSILLIGEVAFSLVLLVGAGLLIKSFLQLQKVSPGFNSRNVLITSVALPGAKYKADNARPEFFQQLAQRLSALPGVEAVGGSVSLPFSASGYNIGRAFIPEGRAMVTEESKNSAYFAITGDYFRALQIPLLSGRVFDQRDGADSPKVVIVNETAAKRHFGSIANALGRRLTIWRDEKFPREIVGVVGDTLGSLTDRESNAQLYVPHAQDSSWAFMAMVLRAKSDAASLAPAVRREVQALDPEQAVYNVRTMEEALRSSIATPRISTQLFGVFALGALLLAAIGIYGVIAYSVTQRTREIGVRMALGAQRSDVLQMIIRQGMTLAALGIAAGLVAAFALTRLMSSLLFNVRANDPATFIGLSLLLGFVALLACYLPAHRATCISPLQALRSE